MLLLFVIYIEHTQGNFDASNLIANTDNTNQLLNVNNLTGNFDQAAANASTSSGGSPYDRNLTIAKYNKTTSNDDIMRISSQ